MYQDSLLWRLHHKYQYHQSHPPLDTLYICPLSFLRNPPFLSPPPPVDNS